MRYLFLGDTHGDLYFADISAEHAAEHNAEIIQVGDWGYIWPKRNAVKKLSNILIKYGVKMRFIDGNHDVHPELRKLGTETIEIEPNVIYQPRGSLHEDADGTKFLFLGGAPSIDKDVRTDGVSWWPDELISREDMERASSYDHVDVIVTHDAPDYPPGFLPAGSPEHRQLSLQSMNDIRSLVRKYQPKLHVHGHWHHYYRSGITVGLDCNYGKFHNACYMWESGCAVP